MRIASLVTLGVFALGGCDPVSETNKPDAAVSPPGDGGGDSCTPTLWYADCDGDGTAALGAATQSSCTEPAASACGGGWVSTAPVAATADCNDKRADVHPGATEVCDGVDSDCDGAVDEDGLTTFYRDMDGDGHGTPSATMSTCNAPAGYVVSGDDCNDASNVIYPGRPETCDGLDNNCSGAVDEGVQAMFFRDADGDGHGNPMTAILGCAAPAGYVGSNDDCNDASSAVFPGRPETCDGLDNNCSGAVDEGVQLTYYRDADGDGHGNATLPISACAAPGGYASSSDDCNDNSSVVYPGRAETCDGLDNNCNNVTDEGVQNTYYADLDGDGFGAAGSTILACSPPLGYTSNASDCNDSSELVNPSAVEQCFNGVDDNCSGGQDEGARCNIDCTWSGARWLSHGFDNAGADDTGAWVTCAQNKIAGMKWINNGGTHAGLVPTVSGTVSDVADCNWTGPRWASQGVDGAANWPTYGADFTCSGGRTTAITWGADQLFPGQIPQVVSGQLSCNWSGAVYLSHGIDGNCAAFNGISVTCLNGHITGLFHASSGSCASDVRP